MRQPPALLSILVMAFALPACSLFVSKKAAPGMHHHALAETKPPYGYLSYVPPDYDPGHGKHPLVIFLHGRGELGDGGQDLDRIARHGPFRLIGRDPSLFEAASAVVLAPQALSADGWWDLDKLEAFIRYARRRYAHDKDRVYLTGLSMGGGATWSLANRKPHAFAALVPICGASLPESPTSIGNTPVWAFHSIGDEIVPFDRSREWLETLGGPGLIRDYPSHGVQSAHFDGGQWTWCEGQRPPTGSPPLGLTLYPDELHDSWTRAYSDPALWQWLFAQRR